MPKRDTLTTGLVDTVTTPMLLKTVVSWKLQPEHLITHHFTLNDVMKAYDTFADAMKSTCVEGDNYERLEWLLLHFRTLLQQTSK